MKLTKFILEDFSHEYNPFAIKNFIISDSADAPNVSSDYPFVLNGLAFAICIKGKGKMRINFKEYEIEESTIITILPFFVTELITRTEDFLIEFLIFSMDFLENTPSKPSFDIAKSITEHSCIKVNLQEKEKLLEFHSFIVKQYKRTDHPFRVEMAKSLLFSLLTEIGSIYYSRLSDLKDNNVNSHQKELVDKFFKLLFIHHKQEKSIQFYADKMYLTSKYLSAIVKEKTGQTAFSWINDSLISSAKYLLKTTNMTILQISEELNFPNPSFFGRFFKKHTKVTPVQYRES